MVEAPPIVPAVAAASIVATSTDVFEEVEVTKENAEPGEPMEDQSEEEVVVGEVVVVEVVPSEVSDPITDL